MASAKQNVTIVQIELKPREEYYRALRTIEISPFFHFKNSVDLLKIQEGDRLVSLDGSDIRNAKIDHLKITEKIRNRPSGKSTKMIFIRRTSFNSGIHLDKKYVSEFNRCLKYQRA